MRLRKDAKVDLIKNVPLFAHCSKQHLADIASIADELDLEDGRVLIREGERGREFFVLLNGDAEVTQKGQHVRTLSAGDFFGEIALVSDEPRTATVVAKGPIRTLVITDRAFRALLEHQPEIDERVQQAAADRVAADAL